MGYDHRMSKLMGKLIVGVREEWKQIVGLVMHHPELQSFQSMNEYMHKIGALPISRGI